jgi:hypothetical protein
MITTGFDYLTGHHQVIQYLQLFIELQVILSNIWAHIYKTQAISSCILICFAKIPPMYLQ